MHIVKTHLATSLSKISLSADTTSGSRRVPDTGMLMATAPPLHPRWPRARISPSLPRTTCSRDLAFFDALDSVAAIRRLTTTLGGSQGDPPEPCDTCSLRSSSAAAIMRSRLAGMRKSGPSAAPWEIRAFSRSRGAVLAIVGRIDRDPRHQTGPGTACGRRLSRAAVVTAAHGAGAALRGGFCPRHLSFRRPLTLL
jgi:hypothetical protein